MFSQGDFGDQRSPKLFIVQQVGFWHESTLSPSGKGCFQRSPRQLPGDPRALFLSATLCLRSILLLFLQIEKDTLSLSCSLEQDLIGRSLQEGRDVDRKKKGTL